MTRGHGLSGKSAIVTGGSRGIGRAVVQRLARDGAHVVFGSRRAVEAARRVEQAVAADGERPTRCRRTWPPRVVSPNCSGR